MENKVSMWKQINYWKVYTQTISKQCPAMINFTFRISTKKYCPFKISSPAEILGHCQWLSCYSQTLATWVWNTTHLDHQKMLPGHHSSSLYSHSYPFGKTETNENILSTVLFTIELVVYKSISPKCIKDLITNQIKEKVESRVKA